MQQPGNLNMALFEDWLKAKEYLRAGVAKSASVRVAEVLLGLPEPGRLDDREAVAQVIEEKTVGGKRGARGRYLLAWTMFRRWAAENDVSIPPQW